ncbi:hypothetical protein GW17_00049589, partial [Ensete ventricosum]
MGVPDVTPPTIKSVAQLEGLFGGVCVCFFGSSPKSPPPAGDVERGFILTGRKVDHTLGHILDVTSGVAASYCESVGAGSWAEGMAHLATLMVRGGSSAVMAHGRFHLGCRCGCGGGANPRLTRMLAWTNRWTSRGTLLGQGRMDWLRNITRAKIDKLAK